jgi:sulfhydrogenase subunit beta (sulfur reductase)
MGEKKPIITQKLLPKEKLSDLISELNKKFKIYAPVNDNGIVSFNEISNIKEIYLDYLNSRIPPKNVLFPQVETIFTYKKQGKDIQIDENKSIYEKSLIFGIRPCDARSFTFLKKFFSFGKYKDIYFLERQKNTMIIGLGCLNPSTTCFCTSVDGSPFGTEGIDILLTEYKENFLVEPITKAGEDLIKNIGWLLKVNKNDLIEIEKLKKKIEESIPKINDIKNIEKKLDKMFDHPYWEEESQGCLGCGTCAYLCPTCHCFDVSDENKLDGSGRRIRIWDTCQFCLFTQETSGHNPRPTKKQRTRQRVYHKFNYYPKNYQLIGCVGCGRCIIYCPVNHDIREIFSEVTKISSEIEG